MDTKALLIAAMDRLGLHDNDERAGLAAIVGGESGFQPRSEVGYGSTSNQRIRQIFGAAANYTDADLSALKSDDKRFFDAMYGPGTSAGRQLGNTEDGDGYRFRGRGLIQLTGRGNYTHYAQMIGRDLVGMPDLANQPEVAAEIAVAYFKDRYRGGGWPAMKAAFGNSFGPNDATKNALYAQYKASGEFDYRLGAPFAPPIPGRKPDPSRPQDAVPPGPSGEQRSRGLLATIINAIMSLFRR